MRMYVCVCVCKCGYACIEVCECVCAYVCVLVCMCESQYAVQKLGVLSGRSYVTITCLRLYAKCQCKR